MFMYDFKGHRKTSASALEVSGRQVKLLKTGTHTAPVSPRNAPTTRNEGEINGVFRENGA
jgi:hypothetical protein